MSGASLHNRREARLPSHCLDLAVTPDGTLFAACLDGGIYRVDPEAPDGAAARVASHDSYASGVNWSQPHRTLITAGYDGMLRWVDPSGGEGRETRSVRAHEFWSWHSALSPCGGLVASCTGQYRCGGYRYEPAPEREPSVRVYDAASGELRHSLAHVPPVQSLAFSHGGELLAAGNLMGEVRIWDLAAGAREVARFTTPDFTGWGIIKGHYFTGGIFALAFAPDDRSIFLAGMGSTRDPAAGNGKQLWQRYEWAGDGAPRRTAAAADGEIGQGLMETLAFHPGGQLFAMAGRLFKGDWSAAVFDAGGSRVHAENLGMRTSCAAFSPTGDRLYLAGGKSQPKDPNKPEPWGRVVTFDFAQG